MCTYSTHIPITYSTHIQHIFLQYLPVPVGEPCPVCDGNPAKLLCSCKGFKGHGICSHVLAINHILRHHNVKYQVLKLTGKLPGKEAGGNLKKKAAALSKQRQLQNEEDDSSDAEEADLQQEVRRALLWWGVNMCTPISPLYRLSKMHREHSWAHDITRISAEYSLNIS